MFKSPGLLALSLVTLGLASPLSAQSDRAPMTPSDLATMDRLGDATVSDDGQQLVYSVTPTNPETYAHNSNLFIRDLADPDSAAVPLAIEGEASKPQFASDGWLYFLHKTDRDVSCDCRSDGGVSSGTGAHRCS